MVGQSPDKDQSEKRRKAGAGQRHRCIDAGHGPEGERQQQARAEPVG